MRRLPLITCRFASNSGHQQGKLGSTWVGSKSSVKSRMSVLYGSDSLKIFALVLAFTEGRRVRPFHLFKGSGAKSGGTPHS